MPKIKPISDIQNNFDDLSELVHFCEEPVFLTENNSVEMVIMSIETYERMFGTDNRILMSDGKK